MHLRQGRHLNGVVGDECGLDEGALAGLTENLVDELALAHGVVHLNAELFGHVANLVLAHGVEVVARLFLDGIEDGQTAEGSLERDDLAINLNLRLAVDGGADLFQHPLCEAHAPVQILVADIELHACELWVVGLVHAFVAEVLAHLIDALEAAHDEALEVELGSYAHVHVLIEGIEMGHERTCRGSTRDVLQDGRIDLRISRLVKDAAHSTDDGGALEKGLLHAGVNDEVHVTLAVAHLWVIE